MRKILLGISLGIIALASIASVYVAANGITQQCGFVGGCNATNVTITKTVTGANQTIVGAELVYQFTASVTVSGTTTTSTRTITYSCPTSMTTADSFGNIVNC